MSALGVEPRTTRLKVLRSDQLSYTDKWLLQGVIKNPYINQGRFIDPRKIKRHERHERHDCKLKYPIQLHLLAATRLRSCCMFCTFKYSDFS